ncbi:GtrA family protein [Virgibacillus soli]|uniref:GtrA family protein n=1 Tax=Paracerasibacillus soli TaxID=480284 RepID=A0ABU5CV56_9BACI|nr:GtrA family protein [Virgibacillus soli]MDY0410263.1 GtrA family protein [Virgibacillus soli]
MRYIKPEFIKFAIVGCVNTVNYYGIYLLCLHVFHFHYFYAHIIGFILSMIGSFFLNVYFTYRVKPTWKKFLQFPLTQVVNTVVSTALLFILVEMAHISSSLAPIIAMFFTVPITFVVTGRILKTA